MANGAEDPCGRAVLKILSQVFGLLWPCWMSRASTM